MEKNTVKILVYNLENFFIFMDKFIQSKDSSIAEQILKLDEFTWQHLPAGIQLNKSLDHVRKIAHLFKKHQPDISFLTEVGGRDSLENFNKYFLNDDYIIYHLPSNSDRGIDLAYLVKKSFQQILDNEIKINSYRKRPLNFLYNYELKQGKKLTPKTSHRFSRDVLELTFQLKSKKWTCLLVHLKSKLDKNRIDPMGYQRRAAECKTLIEIYKELKISSDFIMIGGDFNGNAQKKSPDIEFEQIYQNSDLIDVLEVANYPQDYRFTHVHQNISGQIYAGQIDYLFINPELQKLLSSATIDHYQDFINAEATPQNLKSERSKIPSDHFPILTSVNF